MIFVFVKDEFNSGEKNVNESNPSSAEIQELRKQENTISFGLEDSEGKYIDNGSSINVNSSNNASVYLSLDHNLDEHRKYGLIIFEDYKQIPFKANDESNSTNKFFFDMESKSSKKIKISVDTSKNANELTFLLIKKPEYKLEEMDISRASILEEVLSMRYTINSREIKSEVTSEKETKPQEVLKDGLNDYLFITNKKDQLQTVVKEKENENLILSAGNDSDQKRKYAIVALNDWEQEEIINGKDVIYTTIEPNTRNIFNFDLPKVKEDTNFQFLAFPFPYEVSIDNYESQSTYSTFRVVVKDSAN